MYTTQGRPRRAQAAAEATPCWPGAGLGDDALRAEALREQRLAERVVDLVRAGVREVLALEPHLRTPAPRQLARVRERRRPAHPGAQLRLELGAEARLAAGARARPPRGGRAPAPASRARSVRRRARSGRARPGTRRERLGEQRLAVDLQGLGSHQRLSSDIGAARRLAGGADEFTNARGVLHAALALDARAHVHAERAHGAHRLGDVRRRSSPPASTSCVAARERRRGAPVGALARAAAAALEQQRARQRRGQRAAAAQHRQHALAGAAGAGVRGPRRRSAPSPGAIASRTASTSACDGMQEHRDALDARRHGAPAARAPPQARGGAARPRGTRSRPRRRPPRPRPRSPRAVRRPQILIQSARHRALRPGPCGRASSSSRTACAAS